MNPLEYLKETIAELKAVTWPSPKATLRLTAIVIIISLFVGAYVGSLDFLFTNLLKSIFN